jgi:uncharacterized repeat protein (TIGR03803 family)
MNKERQAIPPGLYAWPIVIGLAMTLAAGQAQTFTTIKSFGIFTNISGFHPQSTLVQGPDGTLYGTTYDGENFDGEHSVAGTVFRLQPDGSGFCVLKWFTNTLEGANPAAGLTMSGNVLYGTTINGGTSSNGTVFKSNTDGTGFTVLKHFGGTTSTNSDGAHPCAGLTLSAGVLYGTAASGGSSDSGTVFRINTDGTGYSVLYSFASAPDGASPNGGLTLSDGILYGTTESGGSWGHGTVFSVGTDGTGYTVLYEFGGISDGSNPTGGLTLSGGVLYGTTFSGGLWNSGTFFQINSDGTGYFIMKDFAGGNDGANPWSAGLTLSGSVLYGTTHGWGSPGTVFQINADGTGYAVLKNFADSQNGADPRAGLLLAGNVLYGTTCGGDAGGSSGYGTVFKVNTDGTDYAVLKSFTWSDGFNPSAGVTLSDDVLFGTTSYGGSSGNGTVFRLNTNGTDYVVLKDFSMPTFNSSSGQYTNSDGASPLGVLTLSGNVLYGTTFKGGSSGYGTVFKLNTNGTGYTVLKNFSDVPDGANPVGALTLSGSVLFGTTSYGGSSGNGTVFRLNTNGTGYVVLKSFSTLTYDPSSGHYTNSDGQIPAGALTLSGNALYGTTAYGGSSDSGTVFELNTNGTGYTVLKTFTGGIDGGSPHAGLTLSGSVLFGTTYFGGISGFGTVFKLNTNGTGHTVLKNFTRGNDGSEPSGCVTVSDGVLYGMTFQGGSSGSGTVFKLNTDGTGYTMLKHFTGSNDGGYPFGGVTMWGTALYGTTSQGGDFGHGTVFKIDLSVSSLLSIRPVDNAVVVSWENPAFTLQAADAVAGLYTNIPGATSPYTNTIAPPQRFFRLIGN